MFKTFRSYQLAVEFYRRCQEVRAPAFLKNQLLRAASSIALNLAEGGTCQTLDEGEAQVLFHRTGQP